MPPQAAHGPRAPHRPDGRRPDPRPGPRSAARRRPGARHVMPWWRRVHLPYLLGLCVLLPPAVGVPWWVERQAMLDQGTMPPSPALVSGSTADLAGSEWELRGMAVGESGATSEPPEGTELVDAVFRVTPSDDTASELLESSCRFRVIDARDRSWEPTSSFSGREMPEGVMTPSFGGCTDPDRERIAAGSDQSLVVPFLVPKDAVDSLRFEVRVPTSTKADAPKPAAVLFPHPERQVNEKGATASSGNGADASD
ncbi:hypothetical protein [Nocardiopsis rhodophaea]